MLYDICAYVGLVAVSVALAGVGLWAGGIKFDFKIERTPPR